jgi:2,4-dienoyl-CoA reductase-like NADH-dependent reductase (Old Yellow Enzyme family)
MSKAGSILFTPRTIGPISLKNRFMRSATWDTFANADGTPQDLSLQLTVHLSIGEVGLIVPSAVLCDPHHANPGTFGLFNQSHVTSWQPVIDSLHARGSKFFFQIFRPGIRLPPDQTASLPTARTPSDHEITASEITDSIELFVKSAQLGVRSGADGIQLHCAHGSFLSTWLSPAFNKRTDKWGGNFENRARIVKEILINIRKNSPGIATSIKFNGEDFVEGGITPKIAPEVIRPLLDVVDLFEISCGMGTRLYGIRSNFIPKALTKGVRGEKQKTILEMAKAAIEGTKFEEEYNREAAEGIRKTFPNVMIALVGGNRQFGKMEKLVKSGLVDVISLSRPLLKNPYLVKEFYEGKATKSECWNCGACILNIEEGVFCHTNDDKFW